MIINNINDDKIINDLRDIINENNINYKFIKLVIIKDKMNKKKNINIESNDYNVDNINDKFNQKNNLTKTNDKNKKNEFKNNKINKENNKENFKITNIIINNNKNKRDIQVNEYKNEINLIYKTKKKGKQRIFGKQFVENNKNNIELIINGNKIKLID